MRLTLWQQFSSNHSAGFMIVGTFKAATDAQQVANEIRSILVKVAHWREQFRAGEIEVTSDDLYLIGEPDFDVDSSWQMTPIEAKLRDEYGLKSWQRTMQWSG